LYVGVTNEVLRRVAQHNQGLVPGHTKRYGINKLVYFEQYADVRDDPA
jgi:putative endonuclease